MGDAMGHAMDRDRAAGPLSRPLTARGLLTATGEGGAVCYSSGRPPGGEMGREIR